MWKTAQIELAQSDPILAQVIVKKGDCTLQPSKNYVERLCSAIISQQISTAAARSIKSRFYSQFASGEPTSQEIIEMSSELFRESGVSPQKEKYLRSLAEHLEQKKIPIDALSTASDEEVVQMLTNVKGIGVWTAEMFLMFSLARPNVFPSEDLGIRKAVGQLYAIDSKISAKDLREFAERWNPWKTIASWYLWRSLETE